MEIKSLEQLIKSVLNDGRKYVSHQSKNLLSHGENYGSYMLDVKIKLDKDGKEEVMDCVAKTTPLSEFMWKVFNTPVTFKKEIAMYREIVPTLVEFGEEKGIKNVMPFFATCFGARVSLDSMSTQVDKDAVLLLENIKVKGFTTADRFVGFNMDEAKLILKDLAILHAVPLAFRLQNPDEFKKKIRPYLNRDFIFVPEKEALEQYIELIKIVTDTDPKLASLVSRVKENTIKSIQLIQQPLEPNELYATMVHNDFWVNNTMLKYENGKPAENIMVDFQVIEYNSPATDLVFFLYSSVEIEVLEDNVDYFIKYYFDIFIDTLKRLGCDTVKFTYKSFLHDMDSIARNYQVNHVLFMLQPIYTKQSDAKDLSTVHKEEDMTFHQSGMHENYTRKLRFILLDFEKRGWL